MNPCEKCYLLPAAAAAAAAAAADPPAGTDGAGGE